jgi:transposase
MSDLEIKLKNELQQKEYIILKQQHRIDQLLRQLYGVKSEKLPAQPTLFEPLPFTEEELALSRVEPAKMEIPAHERKVPKKNPQSMRYELPEHLRREEIVIEPADLPEDAIKIGEEVSEKLEITKAELYVKRYVRPKYALKDKSSVIIGELPDFPLSRTIAGLSLLISILIDKYVDHIPLNRQIKRWARQGVIIKDSTIGDWVSQITKLLSILHEQLEQEVLSSGYLGADETTVNVLDPKLSGKSHLGYYWVYMAHDKKLVLFDYQPSRGKNAVAKTLKDFSGYLQTDAYAAYGQFSTHPGISRLACMAHARRKFEEALPYDRNGALHVLTIMQRIYRLEHWLRVLKIAPEGKKNLRQKIAVPLLNEMFAWMKNEVIHHTPTNVLGKAMQYTLKIEKELMVYTQDGNLHIDNNLVENSIRPVALGRKNYLFMGSHEGAKRSAMLYSFMLSCKMNGINEIDWLEDVLTKINSTKKSELVNLLPHRWSKKA